MTPVDADLRPDADLGPSYLCLGYGYLKRLLSIIFQTLKFSHTLFQFSFSKILNCSKNFPLYKTTDKTISSIYEPKKKWLFLTFSN
jgi:hypothetical protein